MDIRLYDTATRALQPLVPRVPGRIGMYVCGPTVYDRAHIGNARPVVVFDVLFRLLRHAYGAEAVTYVRNFTDVDDKINARAAETGRDIRSITDETIGWYLDDMDALGALRPTHMPRATEYVSAPDQPADMVRMIQTLIDRGHAYVAEGHVLFDVPSHPGYGALSRRPLDEMRAGARVDVAPYKRSDLDFVLWKPSDATLPGWDSPWGRGRPGWHIECSAMARALLGDRFDIHGGGIDLMFPHHENELAQSCCANGTPDLASIWMHNGYLMVEGQKMSKSLGNFVTVADLRAQGVPGEVIRHVLLATHYTQPLDHTAERLAQARRKLAKWHRLVDGVPPGAPDEAVLAALADDLNTSAALARLDALAAAGEAAALAGSAPLLGLLLPGMGDWARLPVADADHAAAIEALRAAREAARAARDWPRADALRQGLEGAGVVLMDGADPAWRLGPDFDPAKLASLP